jgi:hypothetical protein
VHHVQREQSRSPNNVPCFISPDATQELHIVCRVSIHRTERNIFYVKIPKKRRKCNYIFLILQKL